MNTGIDDNIYEIFQGNTECMLVFCTNHLSGSPHIKEDYRKLLELAIIFLGGTSICSIFFQCPGAINHAHWIFI